MSARQVLIACLLAGAVASAAVVPTVVASDAVAVLRAHSPVMSVREGLRWLPGEWRADPAIALDEYRLRVAAAGLRFALVSDLDSLEFWLRPGESRDFVVVLDGKDSCRTRVTGVPFRMSSSRPAHAEADTLTFELGRDRRPYFMGRVGDSKPLRIMFDAGGGEGLLPPRARRKGARITPRDTILNVGGGGAVLRAIGPAGPTVIGTLEWPDVDYFQTDQDLSDSDALVGWRLFDGRVVSFDFVGLRAEVRDSITSVPVGYRELPLQWLGGLPAIEVEVVAGGVITRELLQLDTGSNSALRLTEAAAGWSLYDQQLTKRGEGKSRGAGPGVRRTHQVQVPVLRVAGFELRDVGAELEEPLAGEAPGMSHLGMGVLGHLDLVLDLHDGRVFVRPNARFSEPAVSHRGGAPSEWLLPLLAGLAVVIVVGLGVARRSRRPR